jgi:hypothetical protein
MNLNIWKKKGDGESSGKAEQDEMGFGRQASTILSCTFGNKYLMGREIYSLIFLEAVS